METHIQKEREQESKREREIHLPQVHFLNGHNDQAEPNANQDPGASPMSPT